MKYHKTWRQWSLIIIWKLYGELQVEHPDWDDARIIQEIRLRHRPVGIAHYYPYKAWCNALNDVRVKLGLPTRTNQAKELPLYDEKASPKSEQGPLEAKVSK